MKEKEPFFIIDETNYSSAVLHLLEIAYDLDNNEMTMINTTDELYYMLGF